MNKDNKVLLGAILIILVALVSFNFGDITGKAVSEGSIVAISPKTITAGEYINVYIKPGSKGVEQLAYLYREDGARLPGTINLCSTSKCDEEINVKYKIIDTWDNNEKWDINEITKGYYIRVNEYKQDSYKTASFTVSRKYEAAGPSKHL